MVKLNKKSTEDQILDIFEKNPRIKLINYEEGLISTAEVMEYAKGLGRPRNDLYENIIWKDSIGINGTELYFFQAIHQEAIVIPENIDAIRAMFELEKNPIKSINKTNKCLGI
jgi:glyceraldehyde-3-phosphate dehydrogenase (NAD(P))